MDLDHIDGYKLERLLGRGGMGEVYLAHDERLDRRVAIKRTHLEAQSRERFRREAQLAARLNHPAIVQIYHIVSHENWDYVVMEFVEGTTLARYLVNNGPLALAHACQFFRDVASGLEAAHSSGIVHRDIKTGNIMVLPSGRAKILDFGLAKWVSPTRELPELSLTIEGQVVGTPAFMSPEQAAADDIDYRSDLFSLGVVMYHSLTGGLPFQATSNAKIITQVLMHHPVPVGEIVPTVPPEMSDLITQLLHKDREKRPESAAYVVEELDKIAAVIGSDYEFPSESLWGGIDKADLTTPALPSRHKKLRKGNLLARAVSWLINRFKSRKDLVLPEVQSEIGGGAASGYALAAADGPSGSGIQALTRFYEEALDNYAARTLGVGIDALSSEARLIEIIEERLGTAMLDARRRADTIEI